MESALVSFICNELGLGISKTKTKLYSHNKRETKEIFKVNGTDIEQVETYIYLRAMVPHKPEDV